MKSECLKETERGKKVAADALTGLGAGISVDCGKGSGQVREHERRGRPLTCVEKAHPETEKQRVEY